jgi:hypothetical protein
LDVIGAINATNTSNTTVAAGGFDASTSWSLKVANASTTAGTGAGIFFLGGTNSESWIGNLYESSGVGALSFQTRVSGTRAERMRIDNSGNLLVGATSTRASAKLDVRGDVMTLGSNATYFGTISYSAGAGLLSIAAESGGGINFLSGATERVRITSGGRLWVGAGATDYPFSVKLASDSGNYLCKLENTAATPYGLYLHYSNAAPNNGVNEFMYAADSSAVRFYVKSNGGIGNYSGNDTILSDRREKTNFAPAKSYLDVICAIPVQTFNYIDQNMEDDGGLTLGVVAQDVQAVAPELATESNWASKDKEPKMRLEIYQTDLQFALMKCIQELKAEIDSLKSQLNGA